jgi:pyrroloquinoline quinone biosynthesis protein B
MLARVLGAAAGGGFPQWNCGCPNCVEVRSGSSRTKRRTQDSTAVSADGEAWFVLNASPEILPQIEANPPLHPRGPRTSPIAGIVLTNGDLDHVLGLFSLRESYPLCIYATAPVRAGLVENVVYRTLERFPGQVTWRTLELGREVDLAGVDGAPSGLTLTPHPLPGKLPVHLEGRTVPSAEDNVGLWIRERSTGRLLVYATAAASVGPYAAEIAAADACLFDGTFWSSDELVRLGLSTKRAEDMAHLPIGGPEGSVARLAGRGAKRMIFAHVNNTNPILIEGSPERRHVEAAGWEVAEDGLEIRL